MNTKYSFSPAVWTLMVLAFVAFFAFALPAYAMKRHALLIGVKDYQPADYDGSDRRRLKLRNLVTPCDDIERIASRLEMVGWKREDSPDATEIETMCDASDDQIAGRLKDLVEEYDDAESFLFVYLAGHGVQINNRNYMFAHQATLDMELAARRLRSNPNNVVFQGQSIELVQDLFIRANEFYGGNILLVLDSCRDDPLYLTTMTSELQVPITAPQIAQQSDGIMVVYATTPGKRVSDGTGTSYLADAFVRHIQSGVTVDKVVTEVKKDVRLKTRLTPVPQAPERLGSLNNADACFAGCAAPVRDDGAAADLGPGAPLLAVEAGSVDALYRYLVAPGEGQGAPASASKALRKYHNVYQATVSRDAAVATKPAAMNVDILWCEEGGGERGRQAGQLADLLSGKKEDVIAGARLERVRVRPFGAEENGKAAYRVDRNVIRIDMNSDRQDIWAREIASISALPLEIDSEGTLGLDSISVFLCAGAPKTKSAPRVWIHVPSVEQQGVGLVLGDQIRRSVGTVKVESRIEVVPASPNVTQIRYFYEQDKSIAQSVAEVAGARLSIRPVVVYMPEYAKDMAPLRLELWVGRGRESASLRPPAD